MKEKYLELIDHTKLQVFVFASKANLPFAFAAHTWLVINKKGVLSRWEVLHRKNRAEPGWGHIHLNSLPPFVGIEVIPYVRTLLWRGRLVGEIQGSEEFLARMVAHIEATPNSYPYKDRYSLLGPNSNTYIQSVLDAFPEVNLRLPDNAIGKGFAKLHPCVS